MTIDPEKQNTQSDLVTELEIYQSTPISDFANKKITSIFKLALGKNVGYSRWSKDGYSRGCRVGIQQRV